MMVIEIYAPVQWKWISIKDYQRQSKENEMKNIKEWWQRT